MANTTQTTPAAQADNQKAQAAAAAAVALPQAGAKFRISAARTEQQAKDVTEADNGLLILTSDTQRIYLAGQEFGGMSADDQKSVSNIALKVEQKADKTALDGKADKSGALGSVSFESSATAASLKCSTLAGPFTNTKIPVVAPDTTDGPVGLVNRDDFETLWQASQDVDTLKSTVAALSRQLNPLKLTVSGGGAYEKGSTQAPTFTWAIQNGGDSPTVTVKVNGTVKADAASPLKLTDIKADTTVAVTVAAKDGQTASGQASATFIDPVYYGKVAAATAAPDAAAIKAGTKQLSSYKGITMPSAVALANEKLWYAYPATRGELTGAKDLGVNMDGLSGFQKTVVKVTTLAGEEVNYNVYTMKDAVTASARYAFS